MWVTGYTPEYAVSMWYGYSKTEKGYYNGNEGYTARGKLFRQIISSISTKGKTFTVPSSLVKATIEKETYPGLLPSANTPSDMRVTEYFKKGTEPTETSGRYATLSDPTGLTASTSGNNVNLSWSAASPSSYYNQTTLAEMLKGLYKSQATSYASSIISSNGEFGYEILAKSNSGTTSLGFTTNTKYTTTKQSSDVTYIVKTCYSVNKATESSGASTTVKGTGTSDNNDNKVTEDLLTATVKGNNSVSATIGTPYTDPWITVSSNGTDVTNKATITPSSTPSAGVTINDKTYTFTTAGTYTINYSISYNGSTTKASRTIIVSE